MRVFVGEPGAEHRETFASAGQAAAAGGVTSIVTMPDTDPVIDDIALVDFIARRARDEAEVRVYPAAALTKGLAGREMTELGLLKDAGAVAFTDGRHTVMNAAVMRRALTYGRDFDALIMQHPADPDLVGTGVMNEGEVATRLGLAGIPREAEITVVERDIRLAGLTGGRYHAAQVSCAASLDAIRAAKRAGLRGHLRRLDQPSDAQRERHRRVPHLLQAVAAAAPRGRPAGDGRRRSPTAPST